MAEIGIDVEGQQLAAKAQILPEQDGHAVELGLDVADQLVHFVEIVGHGPEFAQLEAAHGIDPQRLARSNQFGEFGLPFVVFQERRQQVFGHRLVLMGNADRAEQHLIVRVERDIVGEALPQHQEGCGVALIFEADERTAQLQGRAQAL